MSGSLPQISAISRAIFCPLLSGSNSTSMSADTRSTVTASFWESTPISTSQEFFKRAQMRVVTRRRESLFASRKFREQHLRALDVFEEEPQVVEIILRDGRHTCVGYERLQLQRGHAWELANTHPNRERQVSVSDSAARCTSARGAPQCRIHV